MTAKYLDLGNAKDISRPSPPPAGTGAANADTDTAAADAHELLALFSHVEFQGTRLHARLGPAQFGALACQAGGGAVQGGGGGGGRCGSVLTRVAFGKRKDRHENRFIDDVMLQQVLVLYILFMFGAVCYVLCCC